ncbi:MAG TPA: GAF domain-containing protein [Candidatus Limnocylindrales bacterium]|nr:GAF domain-containing protein [Candidatus Limnocylindrales bacterium]
MIRRLYTPRYVYDNEFDQRRANGLQLLVIIFLGLLAVLVVRLLLAQVGVIPQTGAFLVLDPALILILGSLAAGLIVIYSLIQRGHLNWASWIVVGLLVIGTLTPITTYEYGPIYLIIPLIAAGVLLDRRGQAITLVFLLAGVLLRYVAVSQMDRAIRVVPSRDITQDTFQAFAIISLMFALLYVFGGMANRIGRRSIRHAQRLARITSLTPQFAAETSENGLVNRTLIAAQDGLGYALAQIYLVDASGRITRRLRQGTSQEDVIATVSPNQGEASVIADAVQSRAPVRVTPKDSAPRTLHLVAPSRSAVSVPIIFASGRVTAVLDVQSVSGAEVDADELTVLTTLAQEFAAAWEKQTLTVDQARVISEQAEQIERLRDQVGTLEGRSRQTAVSGWDNYLRGRGEDRIGFDLIRQQHGLSERDLRPASDLPPEMRAVLEKGEPLVVLEEGEQVINVPIRVRDAMLGAMAFRIPAGQTITQRQIETVRIVAERLGLALESTRLYEQYQSQARRERKASEVTSVLLGATDMNTLLNAAAGAFNEALGAVFTRVTIEPDAAARPVALPASNGSHKPASHGGN